MNEHEDTQYISLTRVRILSANIAETKLHDLDKTQVLLGAKTEYADAMYLEEKFISWTGRLWEKVYSITIEINNTQKTQSLKVILAIYI